MARSVRNSTSLGRRQTRDHLVVVLQVALQQAHRLGRHHRRRAPWCVAAVRRRRALRQGQPPAVGRHQPHLVVFQLPQHAGRREARRLAVGRGEDGAADHLAQRAGRHLVVLLLGEGRQSGNWAGSSLGISNSACWPRTTQALASASMASSSSGASRRICDQLGGRQDGLAGLLHRQAAHVQADAQLQVGGHQGAAAVVGDGLDVLQDRLARRAPAGPRWPAGTADSNPSR